MTTPQRARARTYTPDVARARHRAQQARLQAAKRDACQALRSEHPGQYERLRREALAIINRTEGPLPGDEATP
jgi:hypothetical protein